MNSSHQKNSMAIVKKYPAKVVSIHNSVEDVYTLEFESLDKPFKYYPGQFLHLAIDSNYDGTGQWPDSRCFSMQSNQDEKNIKITYAVKGKFTSEIEKTLKIGSIVWLKLPYGDLFTQPHDKNKTVFIAGGTGITPYLSLFTHKSFKEYINPRIYLGFRSSDYNIYKNELNRICNASKYVKTYYEDEEGFIDLKKIISENCKESDYFISGPPIMIRFFKQQLNFNGISYTQILTDEWE